MGDKRDRKANDKEQGDFPLGSFQGDDEIDFSSLTCSGCIRKISLLLTFYQMFITLHWILRLAAKGDKKVPHPVLGPTTIPTTAYSENMLVLAFYSHIYFFSRSSCFM